MTAGLSAVTPHRARKAMCPGPEQVPIPNLGDLRTSAMSDAPKTDPDETTDDTALDADQLGGVSGGTDWISHGSFKADAGHVEADTFGGSNKL
jgi:hypothetical protein